VQTSEELRPPVYIAANSRGMAVGPEVRTDLTGVDDFTGQQVFYATLDATCLDTGGEHPVEPPMAYTRSAVGGDVAVPSDEVGEAGDIGSEPAAHA
jgi:hypothetical protein